MSPIYLSVLKRLAFWLVQAFLERSKNSPSSSKEVTKRDPPT